MRRTTLIIMAVIILGSGLVACKKTAGTPTAPGPPAGSATSFGAGQHLVGSGIVAGRYFTDPNGANCYWERLSSTGGIIGNNFIGFDPLQVIVDILTSDTTFGTTAPCGTWRMNAPRGPQTTIGPGWWLVNTQVATGIYRAQAAANCYWERLSGFQGDGSQIIDNDFQGSPGPRVVTVLASDAGFSTHAACGTWSRVTQPEQ